MNAAYRIRPATAADIEIVTELDRAIENVPHWSVADYVAALPPADPASNTLATRRCFFVAETVTDVVGFAVGRVTALETDVRADLESVAVADSVRRAGIGRALCAAVLEWAREQGAADIGLEVRSLSDGPIALYKALGFTTVGIRRKYYREPADDAVSMRLDLSRRHRDL